MASLYDDPALATAQNTATSAQSDYLNSAQRDLSLPDLLRKALNDKFTNNNPLIQDLNTARGNYLNTTTSAPLSVMPENNNGIIFNPAQQEDLINRRKTAALSPIMLLNDLLGIQTGGIQNIIDSTSRAAQAETLGKKGKADVAQTALSNLFDLVKAKSDEDYRNQSLAETIRSNKASEAISAGKAGTDSREATGKVWDDLVKNSDTEYDIWKKIQANKTAWGAQGIDIQQLWNNHKSLVNTVGKGGGVPGSDKNAKQQAGLKMVGQVNEVDKKIRDKTGSLQAQSVSTRLGLPGILGKGSLKGDDAGLADLESKYFALVQNALTYIQGSRPSDYDAKSYQQKLGPSIVNSPKVNEDRINNLYKLMGGTSKKTPSSNSNDPLKLF